MYKKALHTFFLKVHPDFFTASPQQQRVNESAIAQLNELLGWAKEFKAGTFRAPPALSISFKFFAQDNSDHQTSSSSSSSEEQSIVDRRGSTHRISEVDAKFELPVGFQPGESVRALVERTTNKFLRDLLRKSGCIDGVTDAMSNAAEAAEERENVKPLRARTRAMKKLVEKKRVSSLLEEAAEAMTATWNLTSIPTMEELTEADQILFSRSLSPMQCAAALQTLQASLGEMQYERWQTMPLLITTHFAVGELSGTISIPWDFTLPRWFAFLNHEDAAIQAQRQQTEAFAQRIEKLISDVCREAELDDILISCSHKSALPCLEMLARNVSLLRKFSVTQTTLEIGMHKFSTRANGVVVVPASMTHTQFLAWLKVIAPKMELQRKLYLLSKQMLESTTWHLRQFRDAVEPHGVDAFENDCTYSQRLNWAKELYRISGSLAKWDWSEFTFSIGPLEIDWEKRRMTLPHNVDGDGIIRYLETVHEEAKQKKRDALLQESASAREQDERLQMSHRSPHLLEEELRKEFSLPATQKGEADGASSSRTGSSTALTKQKFQQTAEALRQGAPHLEEYIASSYDQVDNLSVERPLAHQVSFASDDEAKDQLLWEGFYDDPYTQQTPASDVDDIQHTYMATNRAYREKAAKALLEELQAKYGKTKRRFDHIKMGDLLAINDPKVKPKGFPIVIPGLRKEPQQHQ